MKFQLGVDVGGTFTDLVVTSDAGLYLTKTHSTPGDEADGIFAGLRDAADNFDTDFRGFLEVFRFQPTLSANCQGWLT